jgi:outer membrane lipoprotein-sorting protein
MRHRLTCQLLCGVAAFAVPALAKDQAKELHETLEAMDRLWFGQSSTAIVSMKVKTTNYERELRLTYWVEGKDKTLLRIDAPAKEKGTSTLKLGQDIYNYLPKIGRTVKVSAALRTGSWMGSHFTNDDLMKASRFADDFDPTLVESTSEGALHVWTVDLRPKPEAAVTWSRVRVVLEKESKIPRTHEFFDEKGVSARKVVFTEIKDLGGRRAPALVTVTPATPPGESTELRYETIQRDVKIDPETFSLSRLKNQ